MGRAIFIPYNEKIWCDYYLCQAKQSGHGLPGFQGQPYQRGNGLGSFFGRLFRAILPVAKKVGKSALKTVGKEALQLTSNVIGDVSEGKDFKQSVKQRGLKAGRNLVDKAKTAVQNQSGGRIGKRKVVSKVSSVPTKRKKKTKRDIFP
jgi:hypothetical protein